MARESEQVPQEWLDELHLAMEKFHDARQELEKWMDATEYRHQERVNKAEAKVREAEAEVERVEARIKGKMKK